LQDQLINLQMKTLDPQQ